MIDQQAERRRERLHSIIRHHFRDENDLVVGVIKDMTGQEVSVRSIQTWLIDPTRVSHRKVPEWVLSCLEEYIKQPEKQEELKRISERAERQIGEIRGPEEWADQVRTSRAVELATSYLEEDERCRQKWRDLLGTTSGNEVATALIARQREAEGLSNVVASIARALHTAESYDEFRKLANESIRGHERTQYQVRDARRALEANEGEFSNEHGLPQKSAR